LLLALLYGGLKFSNTIALPFVLSRFCLTATNGNFGSLNGGYAASRFYTFCQTCGKLWQACVFANGGAFVGPQHRFNLIGIHIRLPSI
jgi:hypothetical protein